MTDEDRASDIYDICLEKKSIYCNRKMGEETCSKCKTYKMYKLGLAEGEKIGKEKQWIATKKAQKKTSAEMKELIEIQYAENQTLGNNNSELLKKLGTYNEQVEKMKNFYNCAHSNRALCPNEHNCKGCKDWELTE